MSISLCVLIHVSVSFAETFSVSLYISTESRDLEEMAPDCGENSAVRCDLGGCIDKSKVCDFHSDCPLGEDEGFICGELDSAFESFHRSVEAWDNISLCDICSVPLGVANQCTRVPELKPCQPYRSLCIYTIILKRSI